MGEESVGEVMRKSPDVRVCVGVGVCWSLARNSGRANRARLCVNPMLFRQPVSRSLSSRARIPSSPRGPL